MSKLISIWGSPNSGKTTLSIKLAEHLYREGKASVLVVFADLNIPSLPVIFAGNKKVDIHSVGNALSKTEITEQEVLKNVNTIKEKMHLGLIGYKQGENKFTYPSYSAEKATEFLSVLKNLVDVVIVDCSSNLDDVLSNTAIKMADNVIRVGLPDLKSISFFSSALPLYSDPTYKLDEHIFVLNQTDGDTNKEVNKANSFYGNAKYVLPYSREVKQQGIEGVLLGKSSKKEYVSTLKALAKLVV